MPKSLSSIIRVENRLNHRRKALLVRDALVMASASMFMIMVFLVALHIGYVKICF